MNRQREFVAALGTALRRRVLAAPSIELLSDRNDKLVEVVRDVDGNRFIRRSYGREEVARIEQEGLSFAEAWDQMHRIFGDAGITIVPSVVFYPAPTESQFPVVVASEYVEGIALKLAGTAVKVSLATSLGNTLLRSGRYHPSLEPFASDMFKVKRDRAGAEQLVLIDVNPYLVDQENLFGKSEAAKDLWQASYINSVANLLWDNWCRPGERKEVSEAFFRSLSPLVEKAFASSDRARTLDAVMEVQSMAQGFDLRNFKA